MKRKTALAAALAASIALPMSMPAHAAGTATICNGLSDICIEAPLGSSMERTALPVGWDREESVTMWTPSGYAGAVIAPSQVDGPGCEVEGLDYQVTVVRSAKTQLTDFAGAPVYAVELVERFQKRYDSTIMLTSDPALRTTGTKARCVGFFAVVLQSRTGQVFEATRADISPSTDYYAVKARFERPSHKAAFALLSTARPKSMGGSICNGAVGVCFQAPAGSRLKRSDVSAGTGQAAEWVTFSGPQLTIGVINTPMVPGGIDCAEVNPGGTMTVTRTTKTAAKQADGMTLFAVEALVNFGGNFQVSTFLTPNTQLRTTGVKPLCLTYQNVVKAKTGQLYEIGSSLYFDTEAQARSFLGTTKNKSTYAAYTAAHNR